MEDNVAGKATDASERQAAATAQPKRRIDFEVVGEGILLLLVGSFMVYMLIDSLGWIGEEWPRRASYIPWASSGLGLFLIGLRAIQLIGKLRPAGRESQTDGKEAPEIMDVGFRLVGNAREQARRFAIALGTVASLFVTLLLLGVHLAFPLWIFAMMRWFGGASVKASVFVAAGVLLFILGVYDYVFVVRWAEPLFWQPPWHRPFA